MKIHDQTELGVGTIDLGSGHYEITSDFKKGEEVYSEIKITKISEGVFVAPKFTFWQRTQ